MNRCILLSSVFVYFFATTFCGETKLCINIIKAKTTTKSITVIETLYWVPNLGRGPLRWEPEYSGEGTLFGEGRHTWICPGILAVDILKVIRMGATHSDAAAR